MLPISSLAPAWDSQNVRQIKEALTSTIEETSSSSKCALSSEMISPSAPCHGIMGQCAAQHGEEQAWNFCLAWHLATLAVFLAFLSASETFFLPISART